MLIAIYERNGDTNPRVPDLSWDELATLLSVPAITGCDPCVADLTEAQKQVRRQSSCPAKDVGAWSPHLLNTDGLRGNDAVKEISVAVIDLDHLTQTQYGEILKAAEGYDFVIHSTHSHRLSNQCYRLVIRLDRPATAIEWPTVRRAIIACLNLPADPQTKDAARLFYLPSVSKTQANSFVYHRGDGDPIEVDLAIAVARGVPTENKKDPAPAEITEPVAVDLGKLRERLKQVRRKKARRHDKNYEIFDRIVRGQKFCEPGDHIGDSPLPKGRSSEINRAATLIAYALPAETPSEAALELLRPCLERTDCEPEGVAHWLRVAEHSYNSAMARRRDQDRERKALDESLRQSFLGLSSTPRAVVTLAEQIESDGGEGILKDWRDLLLKNKAGDLRQVGENAFTILTLSEQTRGTLLFENVHKRVVCVDGPFVGVPAAILPSEVGGWLSRHWDINLPDKVVANQILRAAYGCPADPLKEYLEGLRWDCKNRVDDMLLRYCGALTKDDEGQDITNYILKVGRKWAVSAVARALDPGCQVDTLLILEGEQGKGKTSFSRILGGEWTLETTLVLGEKDTMHLCATAWIIELGELASFKKSERTALKSFLTRVSDDFRVPWGTHPEKFPRRCVFIGTTNEKAYLDDETGNRRYWPVYCTKFDLEALRRDRDQIWAQAVHYYKTYKRDKERGVPDSENPLRWWMDRDEQLVADLQTKQRMEGSHFEGKIAEWWCGHRKRPAHVTTSEVAESVLRFTTPQVTRSVQNEIGTALRRLGFTRSRIRINGYPTWVYIPSEEVRELPVGSQVHHLRLVAQARISRNPEKGVDTEDVNS